MWIVLLSLKEPHPKQAPQLEIISLKVKSENSFLTKTHFAILKVILDIKYVVDDEEPLKILSFISFQIDHKIVNCIMLHKFGPHPTKHPPNYDYATSIILFGQHHEKSHLPIKLLQTLKAASH